MFSHEELLKQKGRQRSEEGGIQLNAYIHIIFIPDCFAGEVENISQTQLFSLMYK